jgi:hypothetical protein
MLQALRGLFFCGGLWLVSASIFDRAGTSAHAQLLGVQECDTRCQSVETDCDLACDQVVACVEECKKASEACVLKCREAPTPTKPDASTKPPSAPGKKPKAAKPAPPAAKPAPKP